MSEQQEEYITDDRPMPCMKCHTVVFVLDKDFPMCYQCTQKHKHEKKKIPKNLRWAVWGRDNFTCQKCGARTFLEVDHIIAESKGGATNMDNLQTLCRPCNRSKGAS